MLNGIVFEKQTDRGSTEGSRIDSVEVVRKQAREDKSVEAVGKCRSIERTMRVVHNVVGRNSTRGSSDKIR